MATLESLGIPFDSELYYVHLHGIKVSDELHEQIKQNSVQLGSFKRRLSSLWMGGLTAFLSSHRRFDNWATNLGHQKHRRFPQRFGHLPASTVSKTLNFIDTYTSSPTKHTYSIQLIDPGILRSNGFDVDTPVNVPRTHLRVLQLQEINAIVGLLRILGFKFITPFISNMPYTEFFDYNSKEKPMIASLDDAEIRRSFVQTEKVLSRSDIDWVIENFGWFWNSYLQEDLEGMEGYNNAFTMILNDIYSVDPTVRFTTAWTGIESLLKPPEVNIGQHMVNRMSFDGLLSKKRARRFWAYRNKVIHGDLDDNMRDKLPLVAQELNEFLCLVTKFFIEEKVVPSKANLDVRYGTDI